MNGDFNDKSRYPEILTDTIEKITELKVELEQTQDKIICGEVSELAVLNFVLTELDQMKQELNQDLNNMVRKEMQHTKQAKKERGI
jgi:hypothetical protein